MAYKIEARIGIAAPIDDVYDIIADIDSWTSWSPIHQAVSGKLSFGAPFHSEEKFEGLGIWEIDGFIADWTPLSHIHITVPKKFFEGKLVRYFEFESLSQTGSAFSVGALFSGFLSEREGRRFGRYFRAGFESFSEALKTKVEAEYLAKPPEQRGKASKPPTVPEVPLKKEAPWAPPKRWKIGSTR
ncbi:SRPBCC domain-containing protein [Asticcacaulis sp. AC402]|uniref:SRPBCC domain-containing protein n=1 Tax=Asticcacaulis sp. AC402 TaxID=1282361 RepID=UPI0003C3D22C|nr:SRPBCC domain-containing protein [Asticcacaulis sp. AC402]ESQ73467.1 polyketide cyclase [Asticcacaulis sp. AC402]